MGLRPTSADENAAVVHFNTCCSMIGSTESPEDKIGYLVGTGVARQALREVTNGPKNANTAKMYPQSSISRHAARPVAQLKTTVQLNTDGGGPVNRVPNSDPSCYGGARGEEDGCRRRAFGVGLAEILRGYADRPVVCAANHVELETERVVSLGDSTPEADLESLFARLEPVVHVATDQQWLELRCLRGMEEVERELAILNHTQERERLFEKAMNEQLILSVFTLQRGMLETGIALLVAQEELARAVNFRAESDQRSAILSLRGRVQTDDVLLDLRRFFARNSWRRVEKEAPQPLVEEAMADLGLFFHRNGRQHIRNGAVAARRLAYRERIARTDIDCRVGEFFNMCEAALQWRDDWEVLDVSGVPAKIGFLIGTNPIYDQGLRSYRWTDPTGRQGSGQWDAAQRRTARAVPPCATPVAMPSYRSRQFLRLTVGPGWWETGEEHITPAPGDYLYSLVGESGPVDGRYYRCGDWDLVSVVNVSAGKRTYPLGPLMLMECGDQQWQIRKVLPSYSTPRFMQLFGPKFYHLFGGNIREIGLVRPKMLPFGRSWEQEVMRITAATTAATIKNKYEAVIRRTPVNLVSSMRTNMLASLEAASPYCNPVGELRQLMGMEAAAEVEQGSSLPYAPRG